MEAHFGFELIVAITTVIVVTVVIVVIIPLLRIKRTPIYYSSFHLIFHYPNITPIYYSSLHFTTT